MSTQSIFVARCRIQPESKLNIQCIKKPKRRSFASSPCRVLAYLI
ncbi:hypothetical protein ECP03052603_0876 [Escherichia coli P0305260.3]|nr:hypothetical protein ECP03052603_0876 [Escherichia coli P0305260.3]